MNEIELLLKDTAGRLFGDLCERALLERADQGHWPEALWTAAQDAGLADAIDPEGDGQTLLPLSTLAIIIRALGEFSVPLPIAETLLAQRHLAIAGLEIPPGSLTIAPPHGQAQLECVDGVWSLSAQLRRVPWGRSARAIVLEAQYGEGTMLVCLQDVQPTHLNVNLANEPRDDFVLDRHTIPSACVAAQPKASRGLALEGALFRTLQMVGSLGRILGLTVQYSMERVQFGRAIAKFQAIQHQVAAMATHAAAAAAAAEAAVNSADERRAEFEIMAAKLRASEAVGVCCRVAHQVHGAMGFTHEHALHFFTRRLMSWRDEYGSESQCAEWIGTEIQRLGGAKLWSYISTPQLHQGDEHHA